MGTVSDSTRPFSGLDFVSIYGNTNMVTAELPTFTRVDHEVPAVGDTFTGFACAGNLTTLCTTPPCVFNWQIRVNNINMSICQPSTSTTSTLGMKTCTGDSLPFTVAAGDLIAIKKFSPLGVTGDGIVKTNTCTLAVQP